MQRNTRILILIVLLGLLPLPRGAHAALGDHLWSKGWSAGGWASPDDSGHVAAAGTIFGSTDFGGGILTPVNFLGGDVFLARFDNNGNHMWSRQFTPGGFGLLVDAVAAAPDGSIYVAGTLQNGDIDFGGGTLSGSNVFLLAAFEPDGSHRWSFVVGAGRVRSLDASNGTLACTGYTYGSVDFGGGTMSSAGGADIFLGILDPDGSHRASALFGDTNNQGGMSVAIGPSERVVLAATTEGPIDFGGGVLTPTGTDLCVAAFDATGAHEWSWIRFGDFSPGAGILAQLELAISDSGRIALAGQFQGSTDMGGGVLDSFGSDDAFLALYNADGSHDVSQNFGGMSSDGAQGISWDSAGNLAVAGNFLSSSIDLGGDSLTRLSAFGADWFVVVFDPDMNHLYSDSFTGFSQNLMLPRFTSAGDLLLYGSGAGDTDFGGGTLADMNFFLAQLDGIATATAAPPSRASMVLAQNAPNPFNPRTTIRFQLENDAMARLEIYDVAGRRVRTLVDGPLHAGEHAIAFDGRDSQGQALASGIYRYRLQSGASSLVKSMVLVK